MQNPQAEINKLKEGKADITEVEAALKEQEEFFEYRINKFQTKFNIHEQELQELDKILRSPWSLIKYWLGWTS